MARKIIPSSGPFRYIRKLDIRQSFTNELYEINHVTLQSLYEDNNGKTHVLVYDLDGLVLAFLAFQDMGTHFHLDLVETNRIPESEPINPGTKLIIHMDFVSQMFGYRRITLLSIPQLISYYRQLGYQETGHTEYDPNYKMDLTKMEKIL